MRKTKIVATLGPSTDNPEILEGLINAGLDVARFNFSHGSHEEHMTRIELLRNTVEKTGKTVAFLADTKGPEIRLGTFEGGKAELTTGNTFTLTTDDIVGNSQHASVSYSDLPDKISTGTRILLDDGLIELIAESVQGRSIHTRVVSGGQISNKKSLNVPSVSLNIPYINAKDRSDLRFFVENNFDIIAASFVRNAEDIKQIRDELRRINTVIGNKIKIIAKIENAEGLNNIDSILTTCDGIMVARGDLGVEVEYEELPIIQKNLISRTLSQGKPVITATQMLESMIKSPRPTRAETSDVANAIFDGTSAVMLSGETAVGSHPVEALSAMAKIAERIEHSIDYLKRFRGLGYTSETSLTNAISHATVTTAHELNAAAILTVSLSGNTAQNVSKFRPSCPILACTPDPVVRRQLKLNWGITPLLTKEETDTTALFNHAIDAATEAGLISEGELVVLTAGVPVGHSGTTNMLKVHVVGEKILV
ncbi:MAG: pyruvate kinase [Oscillospiraceae bacterium]|nr:pyruvate kinase [Oscillospiraceae bacterium]MCL2278025.1 pyruvate kinase [Oscillospiraceae bacterium]